MRYLIRDHQIDKYNILLNVSFKDSHYVGINQMFFTTLTKTSGKFQFHAVKDMIIEKITFDGIIIDLTDVIYDIDDEIYTIKHDIVEGSHNIAIFFKNNYYSDSGIVKHTYGNNKQLIYTRFEPNFARYCYPCFDEPDRKASYNMRILINDPKYQVLFNTDPIDVVPINGRIQYTFKETPIMPTYVASFVVGEFYNVETVLPKYNLKIRIFIPASILRETRVGDFALKCASDIMNYAMEYYSLNYPIDKLDFVPIPKADTKGMENYGLIFIDEPFLLYDKKISTIRHKYETAAVISHEIVHQWFGNLMTMNKWNELWLKESFAKFYEYYFLEMIYPQWDVRTIFAYNMFRTMNFDELCMKSMNVSIDKNRHIRLIYDDIAYYKGAAILYMLIDYMGADQFRYKIRAYIDKHKFGTIVAKDFITAMMDESDDVISNIIRSFTDTRGMPIYDTATGNQYIFNRMDMINRSVSQNSLGKRAGKIGNTRESLILDGDWTIPLKTTTGYHVLDRDNPTNPGNPEINQLKLVNNKCGCYYRFLYNKTDMPRLLQNIGLDNYCEQMSILNDMYVTCGNGLCDIRFLVIYLIHLNKKWTSVTDVTKFNYYHIKYILQILSDLINNTSNIELLTILTNVKTILIKHLIKVFNTNSIETFMQTDFSSDNLNYNNMLLLILRENTNDNIVNHIFDGQIFDHSADLNIIVFESICKTNDMDKIGILIGHIKKYPWFRRQILNALCKSSEKSLIKYLFDLIIDDVEYAFSDGYVKSCIANSEIFANLMYKLYMNNHDKFLERFSAVSKSYPYIVSHLIQHLKDIKHIKKILDRINEQDNSDYLIKIIHAKHITFSKIFFRKILKQSLDAIDVDAILQL